MSDAWGGSWGLTWGGSWGDVDVASPPSPAVLGSSGGFGELSGLKLRKSADPRIQRNNEAIIAVVLAAITSGALE